MKALVLALLLAAGAAAPAAAQSDEIIRDTAGPHQVVPVDGSPACNVALSAKRRGGDIWTAEVAPDCARRIPALAGVTGWRLLDGVVLVDARGEAKMTFVEDETALPTSPDLINPRHYLIPAIPGFTRLPGARELPGVWRLSKGKASCAVTLTIPPRLQPAPACPAAAKRLNTWRFEDLSLSLEGPNDAAVLLSPAGDDRWTSDDGWRLERTPAPR